VCNCTAQTSMPISRVENISHFFCLVSLSLFKDCLTSQLVNKAGNVFKEVNCSEPSPSVRVPWFQNLLTVQRVQGERCRWTETKFGHRHQHQKMSAAKFCFCSSTLFFSNPLNCQQVLEPRNPYWRGKFNTFDLLGIAISDHLILILKLLFFTKQATLIRRSAVLCLPPQLAFPALNKC